LYEIVKRSSSFESSESEQIAFSTSVDALLQSKPAAWVQDANKRIDAAKISFFNFASLIWG